MVRGVGRERNSVRGLAGTALTSGVDTPYSCNYNQLPFAEESSMFETFAVLSTLTCIVIFVVLYQVDRSARREETAKNDQVPDQRS